MDVIVLVVIITATGALKPGVAVAISGVLNLVGAFLSVAVAKTISSGLVDDTKISPVVIFAGLAGAIVGALAAQVAQSGTTGTVIVGVVGAAIAGGIYAMSRRHPVGPNNVNDVPARRLQPAGVEV